MSELASINKEGSANIFLTNLSQIEGRFDPNAYHSDRLSAIQRLKESVYDLKKLKNVVEVRRNFVDEMPADEIQYVGLENIESNTGEFISTDDKESISSASVFKKGDILFPKLRPYLNKVFLAEFDGICSTEFHVFRSSQINNKYLTHFLRSDLVVRQTTRLMSGNTLPRVQTEDIYKLLIPVASEARQKKVVELMKQAYQLKSQKEAKAKDLLNSIDDYLLNELGIELPQKDNSLENRIFTTSFQKISSRRFDPDYYRRYYKSLERSVSKSKYNSNELKSLTHFLKNGKTPSSSGYSEKETNFPIVKVGSYTGKNIDLNKVSYTVSSNKSINIKKGDIFVLSAAHQAEYVGKHIKILDEQPNKETSYVGELVNIRPNQAVCNPIYLFSVLNLEIFKTLINREKTGQTSHVYGKDLQKILVPAPPIEKQNEIANHIKQLQEKAKQLQQEAKAEVEKARQQVEKMILSDEVAAT